MTSFLCTNSITHAWQKFTESLTKIGFRFYFKTESFSIRQRFATKLFATYWLAVNTDRLNKVVPIKMMNRFDSQYDMNTVFLRSGKLFRG